MKRHTIFRAFVIVLPIAGILAIGFAVAWHTSARLQSQLAALTRYWTGGILRDDPAFGYALNESARGALMYRRGGFPIRAVPVSVSPDGFREPTPDMPRILTLGDSFTFGSGVADADTFSARIGAVNGGVGGYGYAQIVLRAQILAVALRPDVVMVQYSPWLVDRAMNPIAPTSIGRVAVPYIAHDGTIAAPVARNRLFDLPIADHLYDRRHTWMFFRRVGLHMAIADARLAIATRMARSTHDRAFILRTCLERIQNAADRNSARLYVLALGIGAARPPEDVAILADYIVIDAEAALLERLPQPTKEAWLDTYGQYARGRLVDGHPNARAHALIADAIMAELTAVPPASMF